jgi:hypothetical protein
VLAGIRDRFTYANVMATIAVFIALGGVTWAAATITSSDVKDNALKSVDLKDGKGVTAADVVPNTFQAAGSENWIPLDLNDNGGPNLCYWTDFGDPFPDPAYFRDREGVVHLRGLVRANDGDIINCGDVSSTFFMAYLPAGYLPEAWALHTASSNNEPARVDVRPEGGVVLEGGGSYPSWADAKAWVSLDGISFRCAPSGQDGCP